jgi:hypothetical protein
MSDRKGAKITSNRSKNDLNLPTGNGDKSLEPLNMSKVVDDENRGGAFENTREFDMKNDLPGKNAHASLINPGNESRGSLISATDLQNKPLLQ